MTTTIIIIASYSLICLLLTLILPYIRNSWKSFFIDSIPETIDGINEKKLKQINCIDI
jgi:hypothetical protein